MKEIIKSIFITCAILASIAILFLIAHYISFKFPETFTTVITYMLIIGTFSLFVYLVHIGRTRFK